jgi:hypothetical protein
MKMWIVGVSATAIMMLVLLLVLFCSSDRALADQGGDQKDNHKSGISLFSFIEPLGIGTLSSVLVTFGTGLFRRKLGKRFLKVHRTFAYLTVGLALCHGILVLVFF